MCSRDSSHWQSSCRSSPLGRTARHDGRTAQDLALLSDQATRRMAVQKRLHSISKLTS
ncbi:hypothetical protein [Lysobacter gummosus]|uniref:hypothetical protein n=1 Tax=Lysobacter gummosus TaxID=262324 RepID=UPI0036286D18